MSWLKRNTYEFEKILIKDGGIHFSRFMSIYLQINHFISFKKLYLQMNHFISFEKWRGFQLGHHDNSPFASDGRC